MKKGANHKTLKKLNRSLVLSLLLTRGQKTRIDIAGSTGLNKMTVGNIVAELIEKDILIERETENTGSVGRNPIELLISKSAPKVVGLYIARHECRAVLVDLALRRLEQSETIQFYDENARSVLDKAMYLAEDMVSKADRVLGIGVGMIGQYDGATGNMLCPVDFFGVRDLPIKRALKERFDLPVRVDNDMNCAAIAEMLYGIGTETNCFLYIGITRGVGAGIIVDGELFGKNNGLVGEIGHMSIDYDGDLCGCGNRGCLELYASIDVIERRIQAMSGYRRPYSMCLSDYKDQIVDDVLTESCERLSVALVGIVNMLDIEHIVIGHDGAMLPQKYIDQLNVTINRRILTRDYKKIDVIPSAFGIDTPLLGGASLLVQQLINGDLLDEM